MTGVQTCALPISLVAAAIVLAELVAAQQSSGLKIVVLEGEGGVNIVRQKTAVVPLVEVRDRNDQPVSGVVVTFAVRSGRVAFNGSRTLTVSTNAAGRAAATGLTPTGSGAVQIGASAAFQGQTAAVTIAQTNVMTAAEAAAASSAGASGGGAGGLSNSALLGIVGGTGAGVIGAVIAAKGEPSVPPSISVSPTGTGIRDVTRFTFTASGSQSVFWDFGDGGTASGASVEHIYNVEGSFRTTVHTESTGGQNATTDVVVGSITGTWTARITNVPAFHTHRVNIVQQGTVLTGQWVVEYDTPTVFGGPGNPNVSSVSGSVTHPRGVRVVQSGDCQRIMDATASGTLSQVGGPLSIGNPICTSSPGLTLTLTRQ